MVKVKSAAEVGKLAKHGEDGKTFCVSTHLYLQIRRPSVAWIMRYRYRGVPRSLGLGAYDNNYTEAKDRVSAHLATLRDGIDPLGNRRAIAAQTTTFKDIAGQYQATHESEWNPRYRRAWASSLKHYVYPQIGAMFVDTVTRADALKILEPIWHKKTVTAQEVAQRCERIMNAAKSKGLCSGDNPFLWKGGLKHLLAKPSSIHKVTHRKDMPIDEVPSFMAAMKTRKGIRARLVEFVVLTGARTTNAARLQFQLAELQPWQRVILLQELLEWQTSRLDIERQERDDAWQIRRGSWTSYYISKANPDAPLDLLAVDEAIPPESDRWPPNVNPSDFHFSGGKPTNQIDVSETFMGKLLNKGGRL
jgi:hypothetical protein